MFLMIGSRSEDEPVSVSVIGCGFLGFPLARRLVSDGRPVRGSTTSAEKMPLLGIAGVCAHHYELGVEADGNEKLFSADVVVVNIPPGRSDPQRQNFYAEWMEHLAARIDAQSYVIFASSTSVYRDNDAWVDVEDAAAHSESASALLSAENAFRNRGNGSAIIRLGGLYGYDRRPGRFFARRQQIPRAGAPVNMIHRDDAVALLHVVVDKRPESAIINACAPGHPSRRSFYTSWAERDGLEAPTWEDTGVGGKQVRTRIPPELDFAFSYPDPMMPSP